MSENPSVLDLPMLGAQVWVSTRPEQWDETQSRLRQSSRFDRSITGAFERVMGLDDILTPFALAVRGDCEDGLVVANVWVGPAFDSHFARTMSHLAAQTVDILLGVARDDDHSGIVFLRAYLERQVDNWLHAHVPHPLRPLADVWRDEEIRRRYAIV